MVCPRPPPRPCSLLVLTTPFPRVRSTPPEDPPDPFLLVSLAQSIEHFHYFAGWCDKVEGKTIPVSTQGYTAYTLREPIGVAGQVGGSRYQRRATLPTRSGSSKPSAAGQVGGSRCRRRATLPTR